MKRYKIKKLIKPTKGDRVFKAINVVFLVFLVLLVLLPLMNLFSLSVSQGVYNPQITFLPKGLTMENYTYILTSDKTFYTSFVNSIIITFFVTILSNLFMALAAYPLSKPDLPFRKGILTFFIITMLFGAGIVPAVLLLKMLGLYGTIWAVIVISISNVFNLLLYKSFFEGLPQEVEEAALIDGVSNIQMFLKVVIPMSLPVFGSCCFFSIVGAWNGYGSALYFIGEANTSQWPLAYYIYDLLNSTKANSDIFWATNESNIQAASIVISIIPILCIYPFVVKYIKSGLTLGSEK